MNSSKHISRWYHEIQQWLFHRVQYHGYSDNSICSRVSNTISFPSRKAYPAAISARGLRARKVPIPPTTAFGLRARVSATRDWSFQSKTIRPRLDYAPCVECQATVASQTSARLLGLLMGCREPLYPPPYMAYCSTCCSKLQLRLNEGMCSDLEKVNADPGASGLLIWQRYI